MRAGGNRPRVLRHTGGDAHKNSLPALAPLLAILYTIAPPQRGQLGSAVKRLDCSLGAACAERVSSCGPA
ncbi:protein of unknown function [Ralstonia solanacearum CMR15]|nr:protein of unknown function [Ralstonia solanacearum CMR15]